MFYERFLTSSPPPGTLQDANSTHARGCRSVGRARRRAGILVLSSCAQEFGSGVTRLELVEAELQARWIPRGFHVLLHGLRVPWALYLGGWVPTVGFCSWAVPSGALPLGGVHIPVWVLAAGMA